MGIAGKMTIEVEGKEYPAANTPGSGNHDHSLRESVYRKVNERRLQDKDTLHNLFTQLIRKRHQLALNAGFANYRDYAFVEKGRFDYTKEDCFSFHEGVKQHVLPLVDMINRKKRNKLGLDVLKPWDTEAEPEGVAPLRPFASGNELLDKSIQCFSRLRPFFADCLRRMNELNHLDSTAGKVKLPAATICR